MKNIAVSATAVALLAACGGGGSDSNPAPDIGPSVALTATNYEDAGKEVMGGSSNIGVVANFSDLLVGAEVDQGLGFAEFVRLKYPLVVKAPQSGAYLSGVTMTETANCTGGGTVTASGNLSNEDKATQGDSLTLTANNCKEDGTTINGTMSITVRSVTGNPDSYPYAVTVDASTNNFSAVSGTARYQTSGSMTLSMSETSYLNSDMAITIPNMVASVTAGTKTETLRYSNYQMTAAVRGNTTSMTMNGGMNVPSLGGNLVTVQTLQPFVSTTSYPTSGSATASTAMGGKMRISAAPAGKVLIELDANSDGTYETSRSIAWNEVF